MVGLTVADLQRRAVAELRQGEAWYPAAFAALQRIWSGAATADDWAATTPFTWGRWDEASRAEAARQASGKNAEAAAVYYADGAIDSRAVRAALADRDAPVLIVAGEYDVALPPKVAVEYATLFPRGESVVLPGCGHQPWLDDPGGFRRALTAYLT
ncbi:alpha/beta fold hydrolase [Micromonospora sp. KC721]|uniref:alpha/beta fold hydrolase n=1 Tax=Micromonospora sp. KC721 TaxID=2530380 RepID=UPI001FB60FFD|nr:alpha/beta hydrolase [Micromonospora sp. KC721]